MVANWEDVRVYDVPVLVVFAVLFLIVALQFFTRYVLNDSLGWTEEIAQRPAVRRGRMVNRTWGEAASQLHERHDASDFELRTQDKLETEF